MTIRILPWNKRNVRAIDRVFLQTWLVTYPNAACNITTEDILKHFGPLKPRIERRKRYIESSSDKYELRLMAKEGNRVIGACICKKHPDKNELQAIYVLSEYQGKGVGKALWNEAMNFWDKNLPIVVEVATYNEKAIAFYEKLGFSKHDGKFHTKNMHDLKNGKGIPILTMLRKI